LECWDEFFRINQIDPNERSNLNKDEREWLDKVLLSRNELLEKFAELNEQVAAAENAGVSIDENELSNITTSVQNYMTETNADMVSSDAIRVSG
jgi:DNA-binding TFAR19-related protein (PDSD5 family)